MKRTCPGRRPANNSRSRPAPRNRINEAASRGRTIAGLARALSETSFMPATMLEAGRSEHTRLTRPRQSLNLFDHEHNGESAMRFGIGQPVTRKEDRRFLTGQGRYVADIDLPREAFAAFLFSPHAHARIRAIDASAARALPGVLAVLTGSEWTEDGLGTIDPEVMPEDMGGPKGHRTKRPPLAIERVRYVGERIAVIIAASDALARDAGELVSVDYEVLPAVVGAPDAVRPGAPFVHDRVANNTSVTMRMGNAEAVAPAFAQAAHITKMALFNNRLSAVTMEPRGAIADYDPGTRRYTLYTSTQNVHGVRHGLAHQILHVPESRIRVVARHVGGGLGMKGQIYPREAIIVSAPRPVGRPVKWIPSRCESRLGGN